MLSVLPRVRDADVRALAAQWDRVASRVPGEVSVHLRTCDGAVASRRAGAPHYAASTVKLAILLAAFAEVAAGRLALVQALEVRDAFPSAAGGSFTLRQSDDQDDATWSCLGDGLPVELLLERMVVDSSNIATNLIVERIGFGPVRQAMAAVCAEDMRMNRLIGDERAQAAGITNTVTAWGLARLLCSLAAGVLLPAESTQQALDLLARQRHRRMIPAGLPAQTWSASKGGWNPAVNHDVALVRPEHAPAYVLAVCTTTGLNEVAERLVAWLSAMTWEHWTRWHMS
jgi:beta-lactamase class A